MYGRQYLVFLAALMLLAAIPALADSMRCGRYVVQTGDPQSRVLELCGEPRYAWQDGFIEQIVRRNDGYFDRYPVDPAPTPYPLPRYNTEVRRIIPIYKWEYHPGPGRLLKTLIFHSDVLVAIIDGPRQ